MFSPTWGRRLCVGVGSTQQSRARVERDSSKEVGRSRYMDCCTEVHDVLVLFWLSFLLAILGESEESGEWVL